MLINNYVTLMNNDKIPYLKEAGTCYADGRKRYDNPDLIYKFACDELFMDRRAEEYVYCLMLNTQKHLIGVAQISHGTNNSSFCNPREILQKALLFGADSIIIVHNHPGGTAEASSEDIDATNRIRSACAVIGIEFCDHVVVGEREFYSFHRGELVHA